MLRMFWVRSIMDRNCSYVKFTILDEGLRRGAKRRREGEVALQKEWDGERRLDV